MMPKQTFTAEELRYLKLLAREYPLSLIHI